MPAYLKGYVIGMGGKVVRKIQQESGAKVVAKPKDEDGFTVTGNEEQRASAKKLISQKVVGFSHLRIQRNSSLQYPLVSIFCKLGVASDKNKNSMSINYMRNLSQSVTYRKTSRIAIMVIVCIYFLSLINFIGLPPTHVFPFSGSHLSSRVSLIFM